MLEKLRVNRFTVKRTARSDFVKSPAGDVIQGTGGLRKIRHAIGNKGKSGSIRVLYVDLVVHEKVYLLTAYTKKQKDNLSDNEKSAVKKLIEKLKKSADEGRGK